MSERTRTSRRLSLAGAVLVGSVTIGACTSNNGETLPTFNEGDNLGAFMTTLFKIHDVKKCEGTSWLLDDGHIRTNPDAGTADVGQPNGDNLVVSFENNRGNIALTAPEEIRFPNDYGASWNWYMFDLKNGQEVFVNQDALVSDKFNCNAVATGNTAVGSIAFK